MKKLLYLMAGVILALAMSSCEKEKTNPQGNLLGGDAITKGQPVVILAPEASAPVVNAVTPYLIPGANRGGNRTCEEAQAAFGDIAEFEGISLGELSDCGDKVDIDDDYVGPVEGFPYDVWVNEDGTIGFDVGDRLCLVKIVIVKGTNAANVYYFPQGVTDADGLASPAFEDGRIPWVSNVTFCCFCDQPVDADLVVAMKAFVYPPNSTNEDVIYSDGSVLPNIDYVGYNAYTLGTGPVSFDLRSERSGEVVGSMTVEDYIDGTDGLHYIEVNIDTDDDGWNFNGHGCYLYLGSLADLFPLNSAGDFPFSNDSPAESRTFKVLVSDVIPAP